MQRLLVKKSLAAPVGSLGGLHVALTDRPDNFLGVAEEALQLDIAEVELRQVVHGPAAL